jgi:transposase
MWTAGIDVAKKSHTATLLDEEGRTVFRKVRFPHSRDGIDAFLARLAETGQAPAGVRVGMEATGHYWMLLFEQLTRAGYEAVVINPLLTSARRNEGIRGLRTDPTDADLIARIVREQGVKVSAIPAKDVAALRDLTRLRFECAHTATVEKQRLIALLDLAFPEYADHFGDLFGATSLQVLTAFPTADALGKVDIRRLTSLMKKVSRGRFGRAEAEALKRSARRSLAAGMGREQLALEIRFRVERLNLLLRQIEQIEKRFGEFLPARQALLQSIPGIGEVWGPTILAEVLPFFHPELQHGARKLVAAAGIDPKLKESGQWAGKTKMSKRGSKYLRTALRQAAHTAVTKLGDPLFAAVYDRQKNRGKHHEIALSHVANKMLHVIFSVLKNERPYRPILN